MKSVQLREGKEQEAGHGRDAQQPTRIPLKGWKDIAWRTKNSINNDHLVIVSGGVAFFLLLGLIPALGAMLMIYGFVADPQDVRSLFDHTVGILPSDVREIMTEQMEAVAEPDAGAGVGAIISIVLALWASSKATKALMKGLNIAYNERERRGFIRKQLTSLLLTLTIVLLAISAVLLVVLLPAVIGLFPLSQFEETIVSWLRWPVLLMMNVFALAVIYRYAPARHQAQWKWVSIGSAIATVLWLIASALFSLYVSNFGNYNEVYGSLGAMVIMLMWLYLTSFLILLGAEINSEMEHQTSKDTTTGKEKPMGKRGAFVADTLGETR